MVETSYVIVHAWWSTVVTLFSDNRNAATYSSVILPDIDIGKGCSVYCFVYCLSEPYTSAKAMSVPRYIHIALCSYLSIGVYQFIQRWLSDCHVEWEKLLRFLTYLCGESLETRLTAYDCSREHQPYLHTVLPGGWKEKQRSSHCWSTSPRCLCRQDHLDQRLSRDSYSTVLVRTCVSLVQYLHTHMHFAVRHSYTY